MFAVDEHDVLADGIVDYVVDVVKVLRYPLDARAVSVRLVGDDERRRDGVDDPADLLFVIADRSADLAYVVEIHAHIAQYRIAERCGGDAVVFAVDHIAHVVDIACDLGELARLFVIAELCQDHVRGTRHIADVPQTVFGIVHHAEHMPRLADERLDLGVVLYVVESDHIVSYCVRVQ